ncbi:MAG: hypothetical protein PHH58_17130 [Rhodoferax sp.]|nr:hypothetical protein [Rhodoferax sp.]
MKSTSFLHSLCARTLVLSFGCLGSLAQAQTPIATAPTAAASASARVPVEQPKQQIRVEDASNRIDEVRVGGETRSITVHPKGGMPSYQVQPATGERRWKVLGF